MWASETPCLVDKWKLLSPEQLSKTRITHVAIFHCSYLIIISVQHVLIHTIIPSPNHLPLYFVFWTGSSPIMRSESPVPTIFYSFQKPFVKIPSEQPPQSPIPLIWNLSQRHFYFIVTYLRLIFLKIGCWCFKKSCKSCTCTNNGKPCTTKCGCAGDCHNPIQVR